MHDDISIPLPSLIHRIGREAAKRAQAMALKHGCELKRVRRSRNWSITGQAIAIQSCCGELTAQSDAAEFAFMIKKIDSGLLQHADKLEPLSAKLVRLINQNPAITLGELMQQTQCSISEARLARFEAEL
ncbi:ribosome recycling factor family protein [Shewanella xiamenensis]|uniref:ribosome recycling factor family protein n=1 Tax=Shewanella xiamenensis TaxID=332186 RepID=UPI000DAFE556|nr:ribosome recycling factor family protein [Shewanella xiamenensis]PZP35525.1 MAG: ribosome recycling factor [Shewanella oneidensis]MCT8863016.1 ribosome recycling factor family protein [Shewanella xiamenensis]MCT8877457.1 ribosome recycling factor family protein [Shewanella xiamenensis]BDQ67625.1 ribosome recycling factor Rrf [Shewanella xiamenensis]GLD78573.1 ribosome recycling factor Rrf [Shewanella xiamenensis]